MASNSKEKKRSQDLPLSSRAHHLSSGSKNDALISINTKGSNNNTIDEPEYSARILQSNNKSGQVSRSQSLSGFAGSRSVTSLHEASENPGRVYKRPSYTHKPIPYELVSSMHNGSVSSEPLKEADLAGPPRALKSTEQLEIDNEIFFLEREISDCNQQYRSLLSQ